MPPVRTARRTSANHARSHYETPVRKILIGEEEAVFKINEGLLQSTSFFAKHGQPCQQSAGLSANIPFRDRQQSAAPQNVEVPLPDSASDHTVDSGEDMVTVDLTIDNADFILKDKFYYTRDAFTIFIRSLNDAPPLKPKSQKDCRALFKAYALAQEYNAEKPQNQVIDARQSFYTEHTIPVDDLLYLVSYWGDRVDCFLAAYMVAQAAYEMALDWPKFRRDNEEIGKLFTSGSRVIIEQLFQAALQYAKLSGKQDPATDKRVWRFSNP